MYPELRYQLMQAQIADLHARARCDALARASRRARRSPPTYPAARLPAAAYPPAAHRPRRSQLGMGGSQVQEGALLHDQPGGRPNDTSDPNR